jgi:hypothetical protein
MKKAQRRRIEYAKSLRRGGRVRTMCRKISKANLDHEVYSERNL